MGYWDGGGCVDRRGEALERKNGRVSWGWCWFVKLIHFFSCEKKFIFSLLVRTSHNPHPHTPLSSSTTPTTPPSPPHPSQNTITTTPNHIPVHHPTDNHTNTTLPPTTTNLHHLSPQCPTTQSSNNYHPQRTSWVSFQWLPTAMSLILLGNSRVKMPNYMHQLSATSSLIPKAFSIPAHLRLVEAVSHWSVLCVCF